jgi:hypothetical protein
LSIIRVLAGSVKDGPSNASTVLSIEGPSNTSATIQRHMASHQKCPGSIVAWSEHMKEIKASLTPSQTEACGSIVQSSSKVGKRSFQPHQPLISQPAGQLLKNCDSVDEVGNLKLHFIVFQGT